MFFHKSLFVATAGLSLLLCLTAFVSAGHIDLDQRRLDKRVSQLYVPSPGDVLITSALEVPGTYSNAIGQCFCSRTADEQKQGVSGTCATKFVDSAKNTATCSYSSKTDILCLENGAEASMSKENNEWWQKTFCKRCMYAGGKSKASYMCP
ncbi:mig2-3 protein [Mycosarcoma maydis]|uniref:Mig2-3 protein n=1 Tax=Mycosarcoma maydis TaxID=5270 RepID=A0A0D1BUK8_MYCMD|nr:mig2-3 protein [Ustilago maydis 521]KIS65797.1 mig2-3 protein [Ustilago maydis 521]|eukprot:XP_011392635.1 mig2-3 protein [Ustilago maydis 521]